ncbi:hypothetical protein F4775DRAFT_557539 [Biscogniauxia sp. FL1348]|nr:hypothetical protein F4775DRAFT_557539 [Biscogniauxia sp. FL1348]
MSLSHTYCSFFLFFFFPSYVQPLFHQPKPKPKNQKKNQKTKNPCLSYFSNSHHHHRIKESQNPPNNNQKKNFP